RRAGRRDAGSTRAAPARRPDGGLFQRRRAAALVSGKLRAASRRRAKTSRWTAAQIPPQHGRVAVVTGANSGLGLATARELARHGARVVMGCRDPARGEAARARIAADVPGADVALEPLDLADLASVADFARR